MSLPSWRVRWSVIGAMVASSCGHRPFHAVTLVPPARPAIAERAQRAADDWASEQAAATRGALAGIVSFVDGLPLCRTGDGAVGVDSLSAKRRPRRAHRVRGYLVIGQAGCTEAYCQDWECCNVCGGAWGLSAAPRGRDRLVLYPRGKYNPISWGAADCALDGVKRDVPIIEVIVTARIDRPFPVGDALHQVFPDALIFTSICRTTPLPMPPPAREGGRPAHCRV
jgi:hypothetical protein